MMKSSERYDKGRQTVSFGSCRILNRIYDSARYAQLSPTSFEEVHNDLKLKKLLKRAVEKTQVPQCLVDSIKTAIRK